MERDYLKLIQEAVEVEFDIGKEHVKAWMRVVEPKEMILADGLYLEAKGVENEGTDPKIANGLANLVRSVRILFYSLRVGPKHDDPRLFKSEQEVLALPWEAHQKLGEVYNDSFVITEEELGNSLRARIQA